MTNGSKPLDTPLKPLVRLNYTPNDYKDSYHYFHEDGSSDPSIRAYRFVDDKVFVVQERGTNNLDTWLYPDIDAALLDYPRLLPVNSDSFQDLPPKSTQEQIIPRLQALLQPRKAQLVYAAESGSRAWGFESSNSDYDVRFIYVSNPVDYLSLREPKQVIEQLDKLASLDFAGWDLKKALLLAAKSNPSLLEWLGSSIVYHDDFNFKDDLFKIMAKHFCPRSLAYHYLSLMKNMRGKLKDNANELNTLKAYFYAIRGILCVMWLHWHQHLPPVPFRELLILLDSEPQYRPIKGELEQMLVWKKQKDEDQQYKSARLDAFIETFFAGSKNLVESFPKREVPLELLNGIYRRTIDVASERLLEQGE